MLLINLHLSQIGTYPIAVCAKQMNKPVYVVAESFKFVREFPLNQKDVPDRFKVMCKFVIIFFFHISLVLTVQQSEMSVKTLNLERKVR